MDGSPPERPQVTLRGAPAVEPPAAPAGEGRPAAAAVLLLLVLAVAAVLVGVDRPAPPVPVEADRPLDAFLELRAEDLSASETGVLVVPVVLHNRGRPLRVRSAQAYAEPVRSDPTTTAPEQVGSGDARRFLVLVEPDCRFLTPVSGLSFRASLLVVVADREGASTQLPLDLTRGPAVAGVVEQLCRD
jgi:hypothetical protein